MLISTNILILGSESTRAAISILRGLKNIENNIYVAISNSNKSDRFAFRKYAKDYLFYNDMSEKDFIDSLLNFRNEIGDFYLFCIGDLKTEWILLNKETLNSNGINFEAPGLQEFKKMLFKPDYLKVSSKFGLKIPQELTIKEAMNLLENKKSIVLKAEDSKTLKKYKKPLIIEDIKSINKIDLNENNFIIQEFVDGPSVYYSAYYKKGRKISSFEQINLVQQPGGGSVVKAAPYKISEEVIEKTDNMFKELNWSGVMMVEYKVQEGKYYSIECNPRYWGPNQLLIDNGVNFPRLMLGLKEENSKTLNTDVGYKWINGYILGFLYKLSGEGKFQKYNIDFENKIKYLDLWKRKDTMFYHFFEVTFNLFNKIRSIFRRTK